MNCAIHILFVLYYYKMERKNRNHDNKQSKLYLHITKIINIINISIYY